MLFLAIYLLYAKLEENHGLARRAIKIYERATEAVLPEERYEVISDTFLFIILLTTKKAALNIFVSERCTISTLNK